MMAEHVLKIWTEYFEAVSSGAKTVELRNDDRGFAVGDTLVLREWQPSTEEIMDTMQGKLVDGTTGRECRVIVTHITRGESWLQPGVVALSIRTQASADRLAALERLHDACRLREQAINYLVENHGMPKSEEKSSVLSQLELSHESIEDTLAEIKRMEDDAE